MDYKKIYEACLREDSLDDWDIDGSIAKANAEARNNPSLSKAVNAFKDHAKKVIFSVIEDKVIDKYGLKKSSSDYRVNVGEYSLGITYPWTGGDRVGGAMYVVCYIGDDYYGVTEEQKKLKGTDEWLPAVKSMIEDITSDISEELKGYQDIASCIDRFPLKSGEYGHVRLRGRNEDFCIRIHIPVLITQEAIDRYL